MSKVMDAATAEHFYRWLEAQVRPEDQHEAEQAVHAALREIPGAVDAGFSWPRLVEIGEQVVALNSRAVR